MSLRFAVEIPEPTPRNVVTTTQMKCGHVHECLGDAHQAICGAYVCRAHDYVHRFCTATYCVARIPQT